MVEVVPDVGEVAFVGSVDAADVVEECDAFGCGFWVEGVEGEGGEVDFVG
jgi:hypothetical protein